MLRQVIPIGDGPLSANLVIGEVVLIHVADRILDERGRVDPRKLRTIARLGGDLLLPHERPVPNETAGMSPVRASG